MKYSSIRSKLIRKYNRSVSRYTSYPTAACFHPSVGSEAFKGALAERKDRTRPWSLYLHIPFSHRLCWFCACNMTVCRDQQKIQRYLERLKSEISNVHFLLGEQVGEVKQFHLGGGTPNSLSPEQFRSLMRHLYRHFSRSEDAEISVEIDPRLMTPDQLKAMVEMGVNRLSLGIQGFEPAVQHAINRVQPLGMVEKGLALIRESGVDAVNMDLIYGLPLQTPEGFRRTLDTVVRLAPNRIALFNFAYLPRMKPQMKLIDTDSLPSPAMKLRLFETALTQFEVAGYDCIGMDPFALPGDPLGQAQRRGELQRNLPGYTTHPDLQMLGFGMFAITTLDTFYFQNHGDLEDYQTAIASQGLAQGKGVRRTPDDVVRGNIIQEIMCRFELDLGGIESQIGEAFDSYFPGVKQSLDRMAADGLLAVGARRYHATATGRLLIRNVAALFDKNDRSQGGIVEDRFSKAI